MRVGKRLLMLLMALALFISIMPVNAQAAKKSAVEKVVLNRTEYVMKKGEKLKLQTTVTPKTAKTKLIWKSSNEKVVTVNSKGVVKATAAKGKAVITVKAGKKKATCKISIGIPVRKITASNMKLRVGESAKILARVLPEKSTVKKLTYKSSNPSVVRVNKGKVKALKAGKAKITITAADRSKVKKVITVTVAKKNSGVSTPTPMPTSSPAPTTTPTPVPTSSPEPTSTPAPTSEPILTPDSSPTPTPDAAKFSIRLADQELTLPIGGTAKTEVIFTDLSGEITDRDIMWKSSDDSIAAIVSADGEIRGLTPGTVTITAISQQDASVSASMQVTVSAVPAENTVTVQSGAELTEALADLENGAGDVHLVTLNTQEKEVTIPKGNYEHVMLIVNAPNASINNKAQFKQILINQIAEDTWSEDSDSGNEIFLNSAKSHLIVDTNGRPNVYLLDNTESVTVDNKGNLQELLIASAAKVLVKGNSTASPIRCQCYNGSGNIGELTTYVPLDIYSTTTYKLQINPGGEQTAVKVSGENDVPEISGLGTISVTIDSTGETKDVVAENQGGFEEFPQTIVKGRILKSADSTEETIQATIYLVNYSVKISDDNISVYLNGSDTKKVETDNLGQYEFQSVAIGNYILVAEVEGYALMTQPIYIGAEYNEERAFEAQDIILVDEAGKVGNIYGFLIDVSTGNAIEKGLTVILRKGINNITDKEVERMTSNEIGAYEFKDLIPGQYTIQVKDEAGESEYISIFENITIQPEAHVNCNIYLNKMMDSDEVRFVLNWGKEEEGASKDLDIYLYGPNPFENGEYDMYFSGQQWGKYGHLMNGQYVSSFAELDVDDKAYEGPETITIKALTAGQYKIFVKDYTNGGTGSQLCASNPIVRIYKGRRLIDTIHMPQKEGGVWFVGSYDNDTGTFKVADEAYSGEPNTSTRAQIGKILNQLTQFDVIDTEAFSQDQSLIDEVAQNYLSKNVTDEQLEDYYIRIQELLTKLQDGLTMEQIKIEGESRNYYSMFAEYHELYSMYGTTDALTDFEVVMKDSGASYELQEVTDAGGYSHRLLLQNKTLGVSTNYYFYYSRTWNTEYWVKSIHDPGNEGWNESFYYESYVHTGGNNPDIGRNLDIQLMDGISITSMEYAVDAEEGAWNYGEQVDLVLHLKKDGTDETRDYQVYYKPLGAELLKITDSENQITEQGFVYYYNWYTEYEIDYRVLGKNEDMGMTWIAEVSSGASYETKTPEEYYGDTYYDKEIETVLIVTNPQNGAKQVYNIYYYGDTSDAEIIGIHDPDNFYTQYSVSSPASASTGIYYTIFLQGMNSELGENLQVYTKPGAVYKTEYTGSESWDYTSSNAKITVTAESGKERVYYVVYGKSNVSCNIRGISSAEDDLELKQIYLDYNNQIYMKGNKAELGEDSLAIKTNPGYTASYNYNERTITVKKDADGSEKIYSVYYTQDVNGAEASGISEAENSSEELQNPLPFEQDVSGNESNEIIPPLSEQETDRNAGSEIVNTKNVYLYTEVSNNSQILDPIALEEEELLPASANETETE